MRKEYFPAIAIYALSALLFAASAVLAYFDSVHWATVGLVAVLLLLFASSRLVKIGNKLREENKMEESAEKDE